MKKTQIDKAIEDLEGQIKILQLAANTLRQQQAKAPNRKQRTLKAVADKTG